MMGLWTLLLLHLPFVVGGALPAPVNVYIDSFDMEHVLRWLPAADTPTGTNFRVHALRLRRRNLWRPVTGCSELMANQVCNLTRAFKEPLDQYWVRVQAFTPTQASNWTLSGPFVPLTDTVLGPPEVSVSGCGNCFVLQVGPPATAQGSQQYQQLQDLYRGLIVLVRRTRDGSQFSLNFPYEKETVISYLEPRVEYCATVTVTTNFNRNSLPSKPHCAFTSPPATRTVYTVLSLLCVFCLLGLLLVGSIVYGGQLLSKPLGHLSRTLSSIPLYGQSPRRNLQSDQFNQISALPPHDDASSTNGLLASP